MKHIGIAEAQIQLSGLIREVEGGHEVVLTRDGRPVAKLVRYAPEVSEEDVARRRQAIAEIREMARKRGLRISHEEIKSWIEEGRR